MKKLTILLVVVLFLGLTSVLMADDIPAADDNVLDGDVPFCANWTISTSGSAATFFTDVPDGTAYDAGGSGGEITLTDFISCTDFDANSKVKISAKKGVWTVPTDYDETNGAKQSDGSDSDLLILVTVDSSGTPTGDDDLDVIDTFGSYTALTTNDQQILEAGAFGEDAGHGIENATFSIDSKVLMDWKYDIVGLYEATVTLTIEELTSG